LTELWTLKPQAASHIISHIATLQLTCPEILGMVLFLAR
jgi:hypothetical protein